MVNLFAISKCQNNNKSNMKNTIKDEFRGLFYYSEDGEIVEANQEDRDVLFNYYSYENKGEIIEDNRVTILTNKTKYRVNEEVKIIHVYESLTKGKELLINGPKRIYDEFVNGELVTEISSTKEYPWIGLYDGITISSPDLDYGFDITNYKFSKKGLYVIQWNPGIYKSNKLNILIE
jgi:hypothetical protein